MPLPPSRTGKRGSGGLSYRVFGQGRAFTLIELLVVVAIIMLLTAFAVPAVNTMLRGSQLIQSAQMISSQLSLARQTALSSGHSVEVRLYQFAEADIPGQPARYRAIQSFEIEETGTVPVGKMQLLSPSVIIDSGAATSSSNSLSTIISSALPGAAVPNLTTGQALQVSIPRAGTNYNAVRFQFLPDGSVNFTSATTTWYITLHNLTDGDGRPTPPPNFITVQIDASNGHIRTFQP